jgi:hypothetical protein
MRTIKEISHMPQRKVVLPHEILKIVSQTHHSPQDLEDGDLSDRIWQFTEYEERSVPVSEMNPYEFEVDQELVEVYMAKIRAGELPGRVVWDTVNNSIIDGIHRVNALAGCGILEIPVLAGVENTYTAIDDPDEDAEDQHDEDEADVPTP